VAGALNGFVLRQVDVGEADRIVSLLTDVRGRLEVRVPRARKSRKRFGGLDLFVLASFELAAKPGKPRLEDARILADFSRIRSDMERLALASHAAELLSLAAPEDDPQSDLFRLALAAFDSLDGPVGEPVGGLGWARGFELKLLHVLGLRPALLRCVATGKSIGELERPLWSSAVGGLLCSSMHAQDPGAQPIAPLALSAMHGALYRPLAEQAEVAWEPRAKSGAAVVMGQYLRHHLGARQRALAVLEGMLGLLVCGLLLQGCSSADLPTEVTVEGYLFDRADPGDDAEAVAGAEGEIWDDEGVVLAEISSPFVDYPGWYRGVDLPPETRVHIRFTGASSVTTVLTGWTASDDLFVDPGVFHLWPRPAALAEVSFWSGSAAALTFSPEVAFEGGALIGQLAFPTEYEGTEIWVTDSEGTEVLAMATDPLGSPRAAAPTGLDGRFAVLGLVPGPTEVRVVRPEGSPSESSFLTWVEEDAITSLAGFLVR
jgi:DNA repair protein RecO (recombination protein O)